MINLGQAHLEDVGTVYGMRMWLEYGFTQSQQELGWADFRVTSYRDIEEWWGMVCVPSCSLASPPLGLRRERWRNMREQQLGRVKPVVRRKLRKRME
jgi:hypothetical protein